MISLIFLGGWGWGWGVIGRDFVAFKYDDTKIPQVFEETNIKIKI